MCRFFLVFSCFVCTRYFICLIRRGKVHENCFPFCFFFLLFFLCSHCCTCCHDTFCFTFLHILCAMPMSVCFSFSHRILSFIYNNGTRVLASCCYSRFILFFFSRLPFYIQAIRLYLLAVDIAWYVCVCVRPNFFLNAFMYVFCVFSFVLFRFFSSFAFLIAAFIPWILTCLRLLRLKRAPNLYIFFLLPNKKYGCCCCFFLVPTKRRIKVWFNGAQQKKEESIPWAMKIRNENWIETFKMGRFIDCSHSTILIMKWKNSILICSRPNSLFVQQLFIHFETHSLNILFFFFFHLYRSLCTSSTLWLCLKYT